MYESKLKVTLTLFQVYTQRIHVKTFFFTREKVWSDAWHNILLAQLPHLLYFLEEGGV